MIWQVYLYWFGALFDSWTTAAALDMGGREFNPIIRKIMDKIPGDTDFEILVIKILVFAAFDLAGAPAVVFAALGGAQIAYGLWNYRWIRKHGP